MTALLELPFDEAMRAASPAEYLQATLAAIDEREKLVHAFLSIDRDAELPPRGFPVAVKDNIVTRNGRTTCASRILESFTSPVDATAVRRLRTHGGILAGKTNLDEFAMGSSTEHSAFGPTRNPWDLTRVPGGSSGGSAAAVAARMVPVALGSDTGGSVRQPAAFCGVVGLKPTCGRVSRSGLVAFASSLDQIGIMTKTVRESAQVLGMIAGHDPADSTSSGEPVRDWAADCARDIRGLRLGIVREAVEQLSGEVRENFDRALEILRAGGASIEMVSVPTIGLSIAVYYVIANAEASANLSRFDGIRFGYRAREAVTLDEVYAQSRSGGFGTEVKRRIMLGTFALSSGYYDAYYGRAQQVRARISADFENVFQTCDALLTPTTPEHAFKLGAKIDDPLSMYLSDTFTTPANLAGIPAIAVPSGFTREKLPLSLQVMAPHFEEGTLFRVASFFERETGYWREKPPIVGF